MIAASPVRHDPSGSMAPVKIHHQYQIPWAFLREGGFMTQHHDLDLHPPPFQKLLNSFGETSDDDDDTVVSIDESYRAALNPGGALLSRAQLSGRTTGLGLQAGETFLQTVSGVGSNPCSPYNPQQQQQSTLHSITC